MEAFAVDCDHAVFVFNVHAHMAKQEMVERQSAPSRKPWISVVPLAMEPSMTLRWEMDLSPGTVTEPRMLFAGESFMECLISI